jgi:type I restriction enzyme S subunit
VIVARHGDSGRAAVVPPQFDGAQSLNIVIVRDPLDVSSRFLAMHLSSAATQRRIARTKAGSVQGVVNTAEIERLVIALPPLTEQRALVARFEAANQLGDAYTHDLAKLRSVKRGLMDDLLNGRVRVHTEKTSR